MNILTFVDYYLPGYKGGGPMRTLSNAASHFEGELCFKIVTLDRDFGDSEPYPGVETGIWNTVGDAEALYLPPGGRSFQTLRRLIASTDHDVLYLNSFFSPNFTIKVLVLRRLGLIPKVPVVLAPRGELAPGALALKSGSRLDFLKKRLYLLFAKALGFYEDVYWQASSEHEAEHIRRQFGRAGGRIIIAPDVPISLRKAQEPLQKSKKPSGQLRIVFLSRISRKKNLSEALKMLAGLRGDVEFHVYGPQEDPRYWRECVRLSEKLPPNIRVTYEGVVVQERVIEVLAGHDLFLLPTMDENFGHVILEALIAGCPVLISDQTPWNKLQTKGAGWTISLDYPQEFRSVMQQCIDMEEDDYEQWSLGARAYGLEHVQDQKVIEQNRELFSRIVAVS